jgi:hypothetical protein
MLVDGACSIYDDRPQTCRDYDCRIFAATGLELTDKPTVATQTRRWEFDIPTESARVHQEAVRTCADYLRAHAHHLPPGAVPKNSTRLAMLAIDLHELFVDEESGADRVIIPDIDVVSDALTDLMSHTRRSPPQFD